MLYFSLKYTGVTIKRKSFTMFHTPQIEAQVKLNDRILVVARPQVFYYIRRSELFQLLRVMTSQFQIRTQLTLLEILQRMPRELICHQI